MTIWQEYVRQDYFEPAGERGKNLGIILNPQEQVVLFDIRRSVKSKKRADCLGSMRLNQASFSAWAEWRGTNLASEPPIQNFLAVREPIVVGSLMRFIPTKGDQVIEPYVPPGLVVGGVNGPWGPRFIEIQQVGQKPRGSPNDFGFNFGGEFGRPWPRENERPGSDFVLQVVGTVRPIDLPPAPGPPIVNPVLRVHWNLYLRYGWYFPPLAQRAEKCVDTVYTGAGPPLTCEHVAPAAPCCDECAKKG